VERENAIGMLWDSERYKKYEELANKLGISTANVGMAIRSRNDRKRLKTAAVISTRDMSSTEGLSDEPRKKILKSISDGKIKSDTVRDIVSKVKEFPEPEQQLEILKEYEEQDTQSREIFDSIIEKQRKIANKETTPEHIIEQSASDIRLNEIEQWYEKGITFTSAYIKKIEIEPKKKKAILLLRKIRTHLDNVIVSIDAPEVIQHE
jgi:predicted RND superfamily exporter protein